MTQPKKDIPKWQVYLTIGGIIAAIAICSTAYTRDDDQPGDPAIYSRIDALTDCRALQGELDAAEARHRAAINRADTSHAEVETSYMSAAQERMRQVGC
jgi:hypothetical protein